MPSHRLFKVLALNLSLVEFFKENKPKFDRKIFANNCFKAHSEGRGTEKQKLVHHHSFVKSSKSNHFLKNKDLCWFDEFR